MRKLTEHFRKQNVQLNMVKGLFILVVLSSCTPVIQEVGKAYFEDGIQIGKYRQAQVSTPVKDDIEEINHSPYWYSKENSAWSWPAKTLDSYCLYKGGSLAYQKGLEKIGLEHGAQDSTGMDDTSFFTWQAQKKLEQQLTEYTALAEQRFGKEAVTKAWTAYEESALYYKGTDPAVKTDWSEVPGQLLLPLLLSFILGCTYNAIKAKHAGLRVGYELFTTIPAYCAIPGLHWLVDMYPVYGVHEQLRIVRATCSGAIGLVISFGALCLSAGAQTNNSQRRNSDVYSLILNADDNVSVGKGKSPAVAVVTLTPSPETTPTPIPSPKPSPAHSLSVDIRQSVIVGEGPVNNASETTLKATLTTPNQYFVEETLVLRNDRYSSATLFGKWLKRKLLDIRFGPYMGWRSQRTNGQDRQDFILVGTKLNYIHVFRSNLSGNVIFPALQFERRVSDSQSAFAMGLQATAVFTKPAISTGLEYALRKATDRPATGYIGPVVAKRFKGQGKLKSWLAEIGIFHEFTGVWRVRARFNFAF